MSETIQTPAAALGPATFTVTVTARGDVRKAMEAAGRDRLRELLVLGLMGDGEADQPAEDAQAERTWKRAIVAKAAEGVEVEERYVLGVVMEPGTEDTHGERISAEVIKTAQRGFMQAYAKGYGRKNERSGHMGRMHKSIVDGKVILLESWIQREDEEIAGEKILKGSWMQSALVPDDEMWADVKKGVLTGFSIGGTAVRVQKD